MRVIIPRPTTDTLKIFIEKAELIQQNGNPYLKDKIFLEVMERLRITSIGLLESLNFQADDLEGEHTDE